MFPLGTDVPYKQRTILHALNFGRVFNVTSLSVCASV